MPEESRILIGAQRLDGDLCSVEPARGLVVFAHGSGSSRNSPRNLLSSRVAAMSPLPSSGPVCA